MKKIHIKTLSVLKDSIGIRTHNHLVRKRTLNHSHKLVWTNSWLFVYDLSSCRFDSCCSPIVNMLLDLTLSWRASLSHRYQSIDLLRKSMDWFLYDNDLRHERVKAYFRRRAVLRSARTFSHSTGQIDE